MIDKIKYGDRVAIMSNGTQINGTFVGLIYDENLAGYGMGHEAVVDLDNGHTILTYKNNIVKLQI